jgi:GNAT superfamily N-acetyltransferase
MIRIVKNDAPDLDSIRTLFREYQDFIGISLCFQSFDEELAALPGKYSKEQGGLLYLAEHDGKAAGCVAFYRMDDTTCELKRLFVRPQFHGKGLGRQLMDRAMTDAKDFGYDTMILDTLKRLVSAGKLYGQLGFSEVEPYNINPHPDVAYYSKQLV